MFLFSDFKKSLLYVSLIFIVLIISIFQLTIKSLIFIRVYYYDSSYIKQQPCKNSYH